MGIGDRITKAWERLTKVFENGQPTTRSIRHTDPDSKVTATSFGQGIHPGRTAVRTLCKIVANYELPDSLKREFETFASSEAYDEMARIRTTAPPDEKKALLEELAKHNLYELFTAVGEEDRREDEAHFAHLLIDKVERFTPEKSNPKQVFLDRARIYDGFRVMCVKYNTNYFNTASILSKEMADASIQYAREVQYPKKLFENPGRMQTGIRDAFKNLYGLLNKHIQHFVLAYFEKVSTFDEQAFECAIEKYGKDINESATFIGDTVRALERRSIEGKNPYLQALKGYAFAVKYLLDSKTRENSDILVAAASITDLGTILPQEISSS
ncbi:hypothetical protein KY337_00255 [Candidatus Woesearchaeota archaeon]|nr:hypothetical protein [Candidatus Woesearchaeota archaeon]